MPSPICKIEPRHQAGHCCRIRERDDSALDAAPAQLTITGWTATSWQFMRPELLRVTVGHRRTGVIRRDQTINLREGVGPLRGSGKGRKPSSPPLRITLLRWRL